MSVRNGFTIEIYGFYFIHLLARAAQDAIVRWREDRLGRYKTTPERVQVYGRRLTAQQKDERQDNDDKKRLARHHPSDLLSSLTRERIGEGQHGVVSPALPS